MVKLDAELKIHIFDVEQGQNEVVLNEEQAKELNLEKGDRVFLKTNSHTAVALVDLSPHYIKHGEIGLFDEVAVQLNARNHEKLFLHKEQRPLSLDFIRKKLDGVTLSDEEIKTIIVDLMDQKFSDAELAAFVSGIYTRGLDNDEIASLTEAIYESGDHLSFPDHKIIASEHSIGGVPGDRVSMMIVPIVASQGVIMPKTASRAISSASGTADAMETMCPVALSKDQIQKAVKEAGGCLVWGGGVNMAAADDKLIRIRHPLRLDPNPLLLSSILAKKKAEGAKYVLLDIPIGKGAKIERQEDAEALAKMFKALGKRLGMQINSILSDGSQPLIPSIGPALEARHVLGCLSVGGCGFNPLNEKACVMAGVIFHMVGKTKSQEEGYKLARHALESKEAYRTFLKIIKAQGGDPGIKPDDIPVGKYRHEIKADYDGRIIGFNNKVIFRVCRALGAPTDKGAGMVLKKKIGDAALGGEVLYELYSDSDSALKYVLGRIKEYPVVEVEKVILKMV